MILILSGTDEGREVAAMLHDEGIAAVSSVPTVLDAARYATDAAIAGEINFDRIIELIRKHNINGIVDAKLAFDSDVSSDARRAAKVCKIPYVKYSKRPNLPIDDSEIVKIDSLDRFYTFLERNLYNTLLDVDDGTIELILDGLEETSFLFVACLKGVNRDYHDELARRNIPITNILEVDSLTSEEDNYLNFIKHNIKNVVIRDAGGLGAVAEKISAAKRAGANVIALNTDRVANPGFCATLEQILIAVSGWGG